MSEVPELPWWINSPMKILENRNTGHAGPIGSRVGLDEYWASDLVGKYINVLDDQLKVYIKGTGASNGLIWGGIINSKHAVNDNVLPIITTLRANDPGWIPPDNMVFAGDDVSVTEIAEEFGIGHSDVFYNPQAMTINWTGSVNHKFTIGWLIFDMDTMEQRFVAYATYTFSASGNLYPYITHTKTMAIGNREVFIIACWFGNIDVTNGGVRHLWCEIAPA